MSEFLSKLQKKGQTLDFPMSRESLESLFENSVCTKRVCEYNWVLEERHSMTWRTFDHKKGKNNDYKVTVDELNDNFVLDLNTFRPHPPYNREQTAPKNPNTNFSEILTTDGRDNR